VHLPVHITKRNQVEESEAHFSAISCNDPDFVLNGEKPNRCLGSNMALSDMPLRKLKDQMVRRC
jgi:hypothetical protein